MPISRQNILAIILLLAIAVGGCVLLFKQKSESRGTNDNNITTQETEQGEKEMQPEDKLVGIQDLIDGEFEFPQVDTSGWKTYRNEEMGYSIEIPSDWVCVSPSLFPDTHKQKICLSESEKDLYMEGLIDSKIVSIGQFVVDGIDEYITNKKSHPSANVMIYKVRNEPSGIFEIIKMEENGMTYVTMQYLNLDNGWSIGFFYNSDKPVIENDLMNNYYGIIKTFSII